MSQYTKSLKEKLRDPSKWPQFTEDNYLEKLQHIAIEATNRGTIDGQLAAILIIHQLTEELIKLLSEDAYFYMQLKLHPSEFRKQKTKETKMFGALLIEIENSISFQNKETILEKARQLNKIRIDIVHKLTKPHALKNLKEHTQKAWELYNSLSMSVLHAHMVFHSDFRDIFQNPEWE